MAYQSRYPTPPSPGVRRGTVGRPRTAPGGIFAMPRGLDRMPALTPDRGTFPMPGRPPVKQPPMPGGDDLSMDDAMNIVKQPTPPAPAQAPPAPGGTDFTSMSDEELMAAKPPAADQPGALGDASAKGGAVGSGRLTPMPGSREAETSMYNDTPPAPMPMNDGGAVAMPKPAMSDGGRGIRKPLPMQDEDPNSFSY